MASPIVCLAAGLQSSGSTLLSWCFLQRADTDGVLDGRFDMIATVPRVRSPVVWVKTTIACFRLEEALCHVRDEGHDVRPLLLVRDPRAVFNSLPGKEYGRNSTTADDPPIRLRLRRFLADYRAAHAAGWPIIRYEDLLARPEATLRAACDGLRLPWDAGMMTWPKPPTAIADARFGNNTFLTTRGRDLASTLRPPVPLSVDNVPADDLAWIESEFAAFNEAMGYPARAERPTVQTPGRAVPQYERSRRYQRKNRRRGLARVLDKILPRNGTASASPTPRA